MRGHRLALMAFVIDSKENLQAKPKDEIGIKIMKDKIYLFVQILSVSIVDSAC
jgi:hypothetical protein